MPETAAQTDRIHAGSEEPYRATHGGVFLPAVPVSHRDDEYDSEQFAVLQQMQERHFWYLGRHRFLLRAFDREAPKRNDLAAIDLGGGVGGWVSYLMQHRRGRFAELALADSSMRALDDARAVVGEDVRRYQIDLLQLQWRDRWDVAFLLDVLEHIPPDLEAMKQIALALKPGGRLFVTTPALKRFWTYNDELVHHVRRYSKSDFARLAEQCGLRLRSARYFMFFLSPLLLASRWAGPDLKKLTAEQTRELFARTHRVPAWPVNQALRLAFSAETPLGLLVPFPWGTSILGVFEKP